MKLLENPFWSIRAHHRANGAKLVTALDSLVSAPDEMTNELEACVKASNPRDAFLAWFDQHPEFEVDAVAINSLDDLVLVERLRPPTVGLNPLATDDLIRTLSDRFRAGWVPQALCLSFETSVDLGPLSCLPALKTLRLRCNKKSVLPVNLGELVTLRRLDIEGREVPVLPASLPLEELRVSAGSFTFQRVAMQTGLKTLYVNGSWDRLPCKPLAALSLLEVLHLENLYVTGVKHLSGLCNLRVVHGLQGKDNAKTPEVLDVSRLKALEILDTKELEVSSVAQATKLRTLKVSVLPSPSDLLGAKSLEELSVWPAPLGYDIAALAKIPMLRLLDLGVGYPWTRDELELFSGHEGRRFRINGDVKNVTEALAFVEWRERTKTAGGSS